MRLPTARPCVPAVLAAGLVLLGAAGASTAGTTTTTVTSPVVSKVAPLDLKVGDRLVIKGKNFIPGRRRNTVVFKRDGQRALFVKADRATRTELVVVVPDRLAAFLATKDGTPTATRFRVRVLSRRLAKRFTPLTSSPRIAPSPTAPQTPAPAPAEPGAPPADTSPGTPAAPPAANTPQVPTDPQPTEDDDCDDDGILNVDDLDDDNDGLPDSAEEGYGTDPCKADTDGDGLRDIWEIESALDLNLRAYFYPGKAPYPNPLWGGDADFDFDGDGLTARVEHDLWGRSGRGVPLDYSDGDQDTTKGSLPYTPVIDLTRHLDLDGNGRLTDDEKDFDNDRLGNWVEFTGPMSGGWWAGAYEEETAYFAHGSASPLLDAGAVAAIPGRTPMYADRDIDGDGLLDGLDDQDHDGWTNEEEQRRALIYDLDGDGTNDHGPRVNAFNPCLPDPNSRTCTRHPPMASPWAPFDEGPPGGYGLVHPEHRVLLIPSWPPVVPEAGGENLADAPSGGDGG